MWWYSGSTIAWSVQKSPPEYYHAQLLYTVVASRFTMQRCRQMVHILEIVKIKLNGIIDIVRAWQETRSYILVVGDYLTK